MKNKMLELMGIQTWQVHRPLPGAKQVFSYLVYELLTRQDRFVGRLLLEEDLSRESSMDKIEQLVDAILFSFSLKKLKRGKTNAAEIDRNPDQTVIIMGNVPLSMPEINNTLIAPHPRQLLKHPLLKKELWIKSQCVKLNGNSERQDL